jgi:hypothetical protein
MSNNTEIDIAIIEFFVSFLPKKTNEAPKKEEITIVIRFSPCVPYMLRVCIKTS